MAAISSDSLLRYAQHLLSAGGFGDELALEMLRRLLDPTRFQMETLSVKTLSAEVVARVCKKNPAAVCISALPPEGVAQTRYLCKRLRAQCPDVKIFVGRWGEQ